MATVRSDYERLGGHDGLHDILSAFVNRVADDFIIGFLFEGKDLARVIRHEVEHAAGHLGGPSAYTGRPLPAVHRALGIHRGHFRRRLAILRAVLVDRGVEPDIVARWLQSNRRLEASLTADTDCGPTDT